MSSAEVEVREVKALRTRSGNTRFVLVDDGGRKYSTFRDQIAARLMGLEGKRVRIEYHEEQRGDFTNVYLDGVEPLEEEDGQQVDEVAWGLAVDAAPYLLSSEAADEGIPPKRLFEKLRRFKELVAHDLEHPAEEDEP